MPDDNKSLPEFTEVTTGANIFLTGYNVDPITNEPIEEVRIAYSNLQKAILKQSAATNLAGLFLTGYVAGTGGSPDVPKSIDVATLINAAAIEVLSSLPAPDLGYTEYIGYVQNAGSVSFDPGVDEERNTLGVDIKWLWNDDGLITAQARTPGTTTPINNFFDNKIVMVEHNFVDGNFFGNPVQTKVFAQNADCNIYVLNTSSAGINTFIGRVRIVIYS
jgi:hypothetical protein